MIAKIEIMFYNRFMTAPLKKLHLLAEHVGYELDDSPGCPLYVRPNPGKTIERMGIDELPHISYATLPGGRKIPLLKTLLTSACENDCHYCGCRSASNIRRETFKPDELARLFMMMYQRGYVKGIFLSSGVVGGGARTQDLLIKTAEILRFKFHYRDYLHLKVMPGSEYEQVLQSMKLADRVSTNLEGANPKRLYELAPMKQFHQHLLDPLKWVDDIRKNMSPAVTWNGRWPSTCTQFVVGGTDENDVELLQISEFLYSHLHLSRTYYSAFSPIPGTPLENRQAENDWRRYRLFQASFLLRDYPFQMEDMVFDHQGRLPLDRDPKQAWAEVFLKEQPVEVNTASREELLHIPGIGLKGANQIIVTRYKNPFKSEGDLNRVGVILGRAAPYLLVNGSRLPFQPALIGS